MADTPERRPDDMTVDLDRADLPADLLTLDERLTLDGERWRRRAPDGRNLPAWARATLVASAADTQTPSASTRGAPLRERRLDTLDTLDAHDEHSHATKGHRPPMAPDIKPRTRWGAIASALAATIVVGAIAALLVHNAGQRGGGPTATATATVPPTSAIQGTATPGQGNGQFFQPGQLPVVAPSDPQIVYHVGADGPSRSTDGGKTYSKVTKPVTDISPIDDETFSVSPLDASHVFLTISGARNGKSCVVGQSGQADHGGTLFSGNTDCSEQFYSADSGRTWTRLRLPGGVVLGGTNYFRVIQGPYEAAMYVIQAQGFRLYAAAGFETQGGAILASLGARILTSADGGATWSLVDRPLANRGLYTCDFAASPTGSTIYAAVTNQSCGNEGLPAMSLWRSDDAGGSWRKVSNLPSPAEGGMVVAPSGALYIFEPAASPISHSMIVSQTANYALVSTNGGVNFRAAPTAGIPGKAAKAILVGPVALLRDGSVVYEVTPETAPPALYAWKPGDSAWLQVAPLSGATMAAVLSTPQPGGGDILTIVDAGANITTVGVSR